MSGLKEDLIDAVDIYRWKMICQGNLLLKTKDKRNRVSSCQSD